MSIKSKKPGGIRKKLWIFVLLVLAIAGGGAYAYYEYGYSSKRVVTDAETLQTATVRQGSLILYASGTGTLIAADEDTATFEISGDVIELTVRVGDEVEAGQLLARLDDSSLQEALAEAERDLAEITSPLNIATAQAAIYTAEDSVDSARDDLAYLISPSVLTWEERLAERTATLEQLEAEAGANPTAEQQQAIADAKEMVRQANLNLAYAHDNYDNYLADYFVESEYNQRTGEYEPIWYTDENGNAYLNLLEPSESDIAAARAAYDIAVATLKEARDYVAALTGGEVPADATGESLLALQEARQAVQDALEDLDAASLYAPISGTVMEVGFALGDTVNSSSGITIANLEQPSLEIYLDSSDWSQVAVDYKAEVTFDALPDKVFSGRVTQVDPGLYTYGNTSMVRAYVELDPQQSVNLPVGMTAAVDVIGGQAENALLVPVEALREISEGEYAVFVMENGKPKVRMVEVGIQDSMYAVVTSGLNAGDVVTTGLVETE